MTSSIVRIARVETHDGHAAQSVLLEVWLSPDTTLRQLREVHDELEKIHRDLADLPSMQIANSDNGHATVRLRPCPVGSRLGADCSAHLETYFSLWLNEEIWTGEEHRAFLKCITEILAPRGYDVTGR